jgi:hypothetical protein
MPLKIKEIAQYKCVISLDDAIGHNMKIITYTLDLLKTFNG